MGKRYAYNKLRGRIVELYGTQKNFARYVGLSEITVSAKLNCEIGFSQEDIEKWGELLNIPKESYHAYFFS